MNIRKNYKYYKEIFDKWNKERTVLEFNNLIKYTPKLNEIFRPCYLPESAKGEPFYKARHALPKYWYISNYGTMLTVKNGRVELYIGQVTSSDRLQACIYYRGDRYVLSREAIVALVFNESVHCTECARELIEKQGIKAFNRGNYSRCVELHHTKGYIHPIKSMDVVQVLQNLPQNSALDAIELVTKLEHDLIHHPIPTAA